MAQFRVEWLKEEKPDWYKLSLTDLGTNEKHTSVSVNEVDKKTGKQAWKDWKNMKVGDVLSGKLWQSAKGGWYLFPSQEDENADGVVVRAPFRGGGKAGIGQAMEKKAENIREAQDNKERSIKIASTFSSATQITAALITQGRVDDVQFEWLKWREWLLQNWDVDETNSTPF